MCRAELNKLRESLVTLLVALASDYAVLPHVFPSDVMVLRLVRVREGLSLLRDDSSFVLINHIINVETKNHVFAFESISGSLHRVADKTKLSIC